MNDEQRSESLERLKRDLTGLPTKEELAKRELDNGIRPQWVSVKYGIDLDRCIRYAEALTKQQETKREASMRRSSERSAQAPSDALGSLDPSRD